MSEDEPSCGESELLRKRQEIESLRELILEGKRSELGKEPMNAEYFQKLRDRVIGFEQQSHDKAS